MENFGKVILLHFLRHINSPMVLLTPLLAEIEWDPVDLRR
jgi:hypothetical protein